MSVIPLNEGVDALPFIRFTRKPLPVLKYIALALFLYVMALYAWSAWRA